MTLRLQPRNSNFVRRQVTTFNVHTSTGRVTIALGAQRRLFRNTRSHMVLLASRHHRYTTSQHFGVSDQVIPNFHRSTERRGIAIRSYPHKINGKILLIVTLNRRNVGHNGQSTTTGTVSNALSRYQWFNGRQQKVAFNNK